MPKKYLPYFPDTIEGQAILDNFTRSRRVLRYRDNTRVYDRIRRGLPLYEVEKIEEVRGSGNEGTIDNLLIRGECLSACAYLKDQGITVDLVYIDPPFASGADYAKKVYLRRNPLLAEKIKKAEEAMDLDELRAFEEKMYGDIWNKEDYLNWMYENLMAIKSVMSDTGGIFVHLDCGIGHYVKILMDEVFGDANFVNEIVWHYSDNFQGNVKGFAGNHDNIFWYTNDQEMYVSNRVYIDLGKTVKRDRRIWSKEEQKLTAAHDENGNIIYDDYTEKKADDVWTIGQSSVTKERSSEFVDYTTQKPEELLRRVIEAGSNEGLIVADFFGGSGVTAAVASRLGRSFIHVDVGINSIQATRDRLLAAKADFNILEVKDGVSLFRNPVQTMDKLKSLITGLRNEDALDSFWEGAIADSELGMAPVYVPNLLDHSTRVLDIPLMNRILNEAMPDLPDETKKVIVYYIDIDDESAVRAFIDDNNPTETVVELRDLKELLSEVVADDLAEFIIEQMNNEWIIRFDSFSSDRLAQKIDEYNQKRMLNRTKKKLLDADEETPDENGNDENGEEARQKKKFKPIIISENGLELIELVSLDCTNAEGIWSNDYEIKVDKNGYVVRNGEKTKTFWDATITCSSKPFRVKTRNIAGDETIFNC